MQKRDTSAAGYSVDHDMAGYNPARQEAHVLASVKPPASFIGTSAVMQALYSQIERAAKSHAPVFIMGETGTGKEVCAETIHRHSPRAQHPFIAINCAAIPRDLLESELFGHVKGAFTGAISDREGAAATAHKGTLFLDEVAEMAPDMQTKLLRFLQNFSFRKVGGNALEQTDVRIICATNRDPLKEIATGHLREDLFFRLHVIPLHMPRLHERDDDVLDIAYGLLRRYSREEHKNFHALSPEVQDFFRAYGWPGNVRQLQNLMRYICVMYDGETVTPYMLPRTLLCATELTDRGADRGPELALETRGGAHMPPDGFPVWFDHLTLAEIERQVIERTVARMHGNVPQAAAHLGVAPSTLYRKRVSWHPDLDHEGEHKEAVPPPDKSAAIFER